MSKSRVVECKSEELSVEVSAVMGGLVAVLRGQVLEFQEVL
jgi:hypothetical protein